MPSPDRSPNLRRPRDGMGGRKVGWYEPPHLIRGRRTTPSNWVTFQRCRRRQGGRGWLLSGAAFFGSCEEFPNDDTTAPRHREGTFCLSRLIFSQRARRNPWVVGFGGMEREASTGGATPGSWNGGGRGGCKSHQTGMVSTHREHRPKARPILAIRARAFAVAPRDCAVRTLCARSLVVARRRPLAPPM